jgi:hypothetical protein
MSWKPSATFLRVIVLLLVFSLAPATLYILYTRTGGPASGKELVFQKNLRFALMAGGDAVDLGPLADWPWVKVCAVGSGLSEDDLTKVIGFDYKDYGELHWLPLPDYWTLLFIDKEREASWGKAHPVVPIRISRKDLADIALPKDVKGQCIERNTGRIEVTRGTAPVGTSPITLNLVDTTND